MASSLMLVSAWVDANLRSDVATDRRPVPEYLVLERDHGVELLDWSAVRGARSRRAGWQSAVHAAAALRRLHRHDAVFSDGEHVGIPLALAMRGLGPAKPHLVIGHRLSSHSKARLLRDAGAHRAMSRLLVHSPHQRSFAIERLGVPERKVAFVPYAADANFWRPLAMDEERLVVAAGREHRDYAALAEACGGDDVKVFVASGSVHSPGAGVRLPERWPANFETGFAGYTRLRELYARAQVVVVPVVATDFQAGVTTVLEAMAMGKPVVTSNALGQGGVLVDGLTGVSVPPGDARALREAIRGLLADRHLRARLGAAAREAVIAQYSVEAFAGTLAGHLSELRAAAVAA